jgi:hypothetical protein
MTGGDALVRTSGSRSTDVTVGASDVYAQFQPDQNRRWVALIGLKDGANQLVAMAGGKEATFTLVNHPLNGTLFATPQQEPKQERRLKPLDPKGSRPADIAFIKTTAGREIPLIIRHRDLSTFPHGCKGSHRPSASCQYRVANPHPIPHLDTAAAG